jgi:hypothetical protein
MLLCVMSILYGPSRATALQVVDYGPFRVSFYGAGDTGSDTGIVGDGNWTTQQMTDVYSAIDTWDGGIASVAGRQIELHIFWSELDSYSPYTLGAASSRMTYDETTIWTAPEYVWREGQNYANPYNYDTFIEMDITAAGASGGWNFGESNATSGTIDFRSVITHELGHSLGFVDTYDSARSDFGRIGTTYRGLTEWDKHLVDGDGTTAPAGGGRARDFNATDDPVYWNGPAAMAEYGGPVPIYAPDPFEAGSSLAHLDPDALPNAIMGPFTYVGATRREPTALEWFMMQDMGWDLQYRLGDFNGDFRINKDDINLLAAAIRDGSTDLLYDINDDGIVDHADFTMEVTQLVDTLLGDGTGTFFGDRNLSGTVDAGDLAALAVNYGKLGEWGWSDGDFNGDAQLDVADLALMATYYGQTVPTVPEPATLSLLVAASIMILRKPRTRAA